MSSREPGPIDGPWTDAVEGGARRSRICLVHLKMDGGGAERHLLHLLDHWDRDKWDIDVVLLEDSGVWIDRLPRHVRLFTLGDRKPSFGPLQWLWALRLVPRLRRRLRAGGYDVVMTFIWLPTLLSALALGKRKRPGRAAIANRPLLLWSAQSDIESDFRLAWDGRLRIAALRRVLPGAVDHAVAVSGRVKARAARSVWLPPDRFTVIPNAIDLTRLRHQALEKDGVTPRAGEFRIVSVGRLHPSKGFDHLLHALAGLPGDLPPWQCFIVGDGPEREALEGRAASLGVPEAAVRFVGFTDNPFAWIHSADLFVLASRWEPSGLVVAEAMALGRAVVATITDGPSEIIADGRDGVLVPSGDVAALTAAIADLMTDDVRRARLGSKAARTVEPYDAPRVAEAYAQVMEGLLAQRKS